MAYLLLTFSCRNGQAVNKYHLPLAFLYGLNRSLFTQIPRLPVCQQHKVICEQRSINLNSGPRRDGWVGPLGQVDDQGLSLTPKTGSEIRRGHREGREH